jgi:hypothetical protein
MTATRIQLLLLFGFIAFTDLVIAKDSFPLSIPLYQQIPSESQSEIVPRGVVRYDPSQSDPVIYTENSRKPDFASGNGIYRVGLFDDAKNQLGPAGFTKLVRRCVNCFNLMIGRC